MICYLKQAKALMEKSRYSDLSGRVVPTVSNPKGKNSEVRSGAHRLKPMVVGWCGYLSVMGVTYRIFYLG
jgi:hypothetical protein